MCFGAAGTRDRRAAESAKDSVRSIKNFHDTVVNQRAKLANRLVVAARMDAVGQDRNRDLAFRFDPDRGSGKTKMADRGRREMSAGAGVTGGRSVPTERPGRALHNV